MIVLHKLTGTEIVINAELIESVEAGPQTVIALSTGNRFIVKEAPDEVTARVIEYRRKVGAPGKTAPQAK